MIKTITNYISTHHSTQLLAATGGFCAIAAAEMAIKAVGDAIKLANISDDDPRKTKISKDFSSNISGAVLFAMFASNAIPYLSVIGSLLFIGSALCDNIKEDALITTKLINVFAPMADAVVNTFVDVTSQLLRGIWQVFSSIIETISNILSPIVTVLGRMLNAIIPKDPKAYAAIPLAVAIAFYNLG